MKKAIIKDYFEFKKCKYEINLINQQIRGCSHKDSKNIDITKCGNNCPYYKEIITEVCTTYNNSDKMEI